MSDGRWVVGNSQDVQHILYVIQLDPQTVKAGVSDVEKLYRALDRYSDWYSDCTRVVLNGEVCGKLEMGCCKLS